MLKDFIMILREDHRCQVTQNCNICHRILRSYIVNRPGVAGAVLHTASSLINSFINSVSEPFPPDLHNIINHKR